MWGFAQAFRMISHDLGFVPFVLYGCILMYLICLAWDPNNIRSGGMMSFLSPSGRSSVIFGASGALPVFQYGRWWTVLSASFLHGGLLHIFFNMYWVRMLLPATISHYGASRTVIIYTAASITGFYASSLMGVLLPGVDYIGGSSVTLGASASIFGLLGGLVRSGSAAGSQAKMYAIFMGLFGFIMPGIDNWAHGAGFLGGYLAARWLDPLQKETQTHVFIALGCMAAFVLSILYSVLDAYAIL